MPYQQPHVLQLTLTAGVPLQIVADPNSTLRFQRSVTLCPHYSNTGRIFVGDLNVTKDFFSAYLVPGQNVGSIKADTIQQSSIDAYYQQNMVNFADLSAWWVVSEITGDILFATLQFIPG